jgi:ribonuclease D
MKWIDTQPDLDAALATVAGHGSFAIDTEADSLHSYFDKVCLIQLSVPGHDFVVDPLAKIDLGGLGPLLSDAAKTKVLHGADYDLRIMDRDFGFRVVNLIDTMVSAQLAGYEAFGLSALLKRHFNVDLDKTHQRADWAMRPLSPQMLRYASLDTQYLLELGVRMRSELESLGRWEWAEEEFRRLETIRFREEDPESERWRRLKGLSALSRRSLGAVARLHDWRDRTARSIDRPPFKVLGNDTILSIATHLPKNEDELVKIRGVSPFVQQKHGRAMLEIVRAVLEAGEAELPEKSEKKSWMRDREVERAVERLKRVRDEVAASLRLDPAVLAPRHVLAAVATARPRELNELDAIPAMREWQKQLVGRQLIAAIQ